MAKTKISEFDVDPANNTDINSINIAEGCAPSGINNAIRQLMSDLKEFQTGAASDSFTVGGAFSANGGATLGDASGDALTINSSAVSIPNGLNFDSNTLVIDASNNRVGVGTASPSQRLHVANAGTVAIQAENTASSGSAYLNAKNTATTCAFGVDASGGYIETAGAYSTIFYTNSTERVRIDSSGNVGIGTSSPSRKLSVAGAVGVGSDSSSTYELYISQSSSYARIGPTYSGGGAYTPLTFWTSDTERMRLDASGNLGLGVTPFTNSLNAGFDLVGGAGLFGYGGSGTYLNNNAYYNAGWKYKATAVSSRYEMGSGHQWFIAPSGTAGNAITFTQAMTLDASGNLGIGTTSPSSFVFNKLVLGTTSGSAGMTIASGTTGEGTLAFADGTSGSDNYRGYIQYGHTSDALIFGTSATERMRIDTSGNLCIGTTSAPVSNLKIRAVYGNSDFSFGPQTGGAKFAVYNASGTGVYLSDGGTSWTANSDERIKDIIEPITDAANKVSSLRAVIGKYKTDEEGTRRSFLIAQDVQAVLPEAVNQQNDEIGTLGIAYTETIPLLVAAIKELKAEVDSLKAQLNK